MKYKLLKDLPFPQFIEMENKDPCPFKIGDRIWVRDADENPAEKIYLCYIQGASHPYVCVSGGDEGAYNEGTHFNYQGRRKATSLGIPVEDLVITD